ncbi:hypothetical protein ACHAWX_000235 [Stephanocyclus meneghinianus]
MRSKITKFTTYFALASSVQRTTTGALALSPTLLPTTNPIEAQHATFDDQFGAPHCKNVGSECNSLDLLRGVDGNESNSPNSFDGCGDDSIGT